MFTLEESALLGRMLRFVGWTLVMLVVVALLYLLVRNGPRPKGHVAGTDKRGDVNSAMRIYCAVLAAEHAGPL
jgi:hypothetical protein